MFLCEVYNSSFIFVSCYVVRNEWDRHTNAKSLGCHVTIFKSYFEIDVNL